MTLQCSGSVRHVLLKCYKNSENSQIALLEDRYHVVWLFVSLFLHFPIFFRRSQRDGWTNSSRSGSRSPEASHGGSGPEQAGGAGQQRDRHRRRNSGRSAGKHCVVEKDLPDFINILLIFNKCGDKTTLNNSCHLKTVFPSVIWWSFAIANSPLSHVWIC